MMNKEERVIKICIMFLLAFLTVNSFAKTRAEKIADKKEFRNAKAICLMNDSLIRGNRLKDCIKMEIEKSKNSDSSIRANKSR